MPQTITIHLPDGSSFDVELDDELWLDVQAYCAAAECTVDELVAAAMRRFFDEHPA